jgi:hypothetical protein
MPLDPIELSTGESPRNTPNFIDENPNQEMVREGLDVSENELRDAADDEYGIDPSLPLANEIGESDDDLSPEVAAIHEIGVPDDDDDDEAIG